jgi:hypothetical protein
VCVEINNTGRAVPQVGFYVTAEPRSSAFRHGPVRRHVYVCGLHCDRLSEFRSRRVPVSRTELLVGCTLCVTFLGGRLLGSLGISGAKERMTEVFPTGLGAGAWEGTRTCVSLEDPASSHVLVAVQASLRWRNFISLQRVSAASYS